MLLVSSCVCRTIPHQDAIPHARNGGDDSLDLRVIPLRWNVNMDVLGFEQRAAVYTEENTEEMEAHLHPQCVTPDCHARVSPRMHSYVQFET